MRRVWIAIAALLGGAAGYVVAFLVGMAATSSSECDGICFQRSTEISYIAFVIAAICALGFGLTARRILRERLADRSATPSA